MTIKRSIRTAVLTAASFTCITAATLSLPFCSPSFTALARAKMVTIKVRDDSAYPVQLHCQSREQDITVQPGKTISLRIAVGDTLIAVNPLPPNYPAGAKIIQISSDLDDSTITIH